MVRRVFSNNLTKEKIMETFNDKYGYFEIDFVTDRIVCVYSKHSEYYKFNTESEFYKCTRDISDTVVRNKNALDLKCVNLISKCIMGRSKGVNKYIDEHNLGNYIKSYAEIARMI